MKLKSYCIPLCCVCGTLCLNQSPVAHAYPTEEARACVSVDGHVVSQEHHDPVVGATVWVEGVFKTYTDANGHFELQSLCGSTDAFVINGPSIKRKKVALPQNDKKHVSLEIVVQLKAEESVEVVGNSRGPFESKHIVDLTKEDLNKTRGQNLTAVLKDVPGVSSLGSGTSVHKPILRGQFGRRLSIVAGGVQHKSQSWGLDHPPEIEPFTADQIRVVQGASGVRYGTSAVGGALVLTPPKLNIGIGTKSELHLTHTAAQGYGVQSRVMHKPHWQKDWTLSLEGTAKKLSPNANPDFTYRNAGQKEWSLGGALGVQKKNYSWQMAYNRFNAKLGVCLCFNINSLTDFIERESDVSVFNSFTSSPEINRSFQTTDHQKLTSTFRLELPSLGELEVVGGVQKNDRKEFDFVRTTTGPQLEFDVATQEANVVFHHHPKHLNQHLHIRGEMGLGLRRQDQDFNSNETRTLVPDYKAWDGHVFFVERLLGHHFELEAGARFGVLRRVARLGAKDVAKLGIDDQIDDDSCDPQDEGAVCNSTFRSLSATVGGAYQVIEPWTLKANVSYTERPPDVDEQFLNGVAPSFPVFGQGDFRFGVEKTLSLSVTSLLRLERLQASVSIYNNRVFDYIYFQPQVNEPLEVSAGGRFAVFRNVAIDARIRGVDGSVNWLVKPFWKVGAKFALIDGIDLENERSISFIPSNSVALNTELRFGKERNAWIGGRVERVFRKNNLDLDADFLDAPPTYTLVHMDAGLKTWVKDREVQMSVRGANILNQRYRDITSISRYFVDSPGMQWMFRMSVFM